MTVARFRLALASLAGILALREPGARTSFALFIKQEDTMSMSRALAPVRFVVVVAAISTFSVCVGQQSGQPSAAGTSMQTSPPDRATAIQQSILQNAKDPDVPNRTKVVRLIVVPQTLNLADATAVRAFAMGRNATRVDVFVVRTNTGWVPMSWLGGGLVDHHVAPDQHVESVLVLMVSHREQVQWESDVPFRVARIVASNHAGFPSMGTAPMSIPFKGVIGKLGGPGQPIVSGPPDFNNNNPYDQLYKATFSMDLPGTGWTDVDPDIYCDWQ